MHLETYSIEEKEFAEIKFPTFEDCNLNSQFRYEITFDNLMNDLKSSVDILTNFENAFSLLLTNDFNGKIKENFKLHLMNYINCKAICIIQKRLLILVSYKLKLIYDNSFIEEYLTNLIKSEYCHSEQFLENLILQVELIKTENDEILKSELKEIIKTAFKSEQEIIFINYKISISGLSILINLNKSILEKGIEDLYYLLNTNSDKNFIEIFQIFVKMEILTNLIPKAFRVPETDLFNLKENSKTWMEIKNHYQRIIPHCGHLMKKKLERLLNFVILGNASIANGFKYGNNYLKFISTGYYLTYYFFNQKKANYESKKYNLKPEFELSRMVWNLLDQKVIRQGYSSILYGISNIKYREIMYIKKTKKKISLEYIGNIMNVMNGNSKNNYNLNGGNKNTDDRDSDSLPLLEKYISSQYQKFYVPIKFLSNTFINIPKFTNKSFTSKIFNFFKFYNFNQKRNFTRNALIIHIHGGGFVAMSSSSHENYLRKWCNRLEVPIISIDYSLAPENPYPIPLDDVWQAYNWIIENAENEFQLDLNKIILIGDSAGGNLVMALMNLLIIHNLRLPDAVFIAYPALRVNDDFYSPSFLVSLNDVILSFHLLIFCLKSYRQNYEIVDDPFLSPIYTGKELLSKYPPTRIIVGSSDPLRDDTIRLLKNFIDAKCDVKLIEFKYFPHGFLSYDLPIFLPEASIANEFIINEIEKFLSI